MIRVRFPLPAHSFKTAERLFFYWGKFLKNSVYARIAGMKEENNLGYDEFFEKARTELGLGNLAVARVIAEQRGSYRVKTEKNEYLAKITGKQMFKANSREDYPAVGDWVAIVDSGNNQAVIKAILPRKTIIKRKSNNENKIQVNPTNIYVTFMV